MKITALAVRSACALLLAAAGAAAASAPVLSSVSPNPLIAGSSPTVTIQGSGFQPGALVYLTYGSNSMMLDAAGP